MVRPRPDPKGVYFYVGYQPLMSNDEMIVLFDKLEPAKRRRAGRRGTRHDAVGAGK